MLEVTVKNRSVKVVESVTIRKTGVENIKWSPNNLEMFPTVWSGDCIKRN